MAIMLSRSLCRCAASHAYGTSSMAALPCSISGRSISFFGGKRSKPEADEPPRDEFTNAPMTDDFNESALKSIAAKGLGKVRKPYTPPNNVQRTVQQIWRRMFANDPKMSQVDNAFPLNDLKLRFAFLLACEREFGYKIPNCDLRRMKTIHDAVVYFSTPVRGELGINNLKSRGDLPRNLHVETQPLRFHPDTDTFFGGISAYPFSSTYVSGLKARKLYKGYRFHADWPRALDSAMLRRDDYPYGYANIESFPYRMYPNE